MKQENYLISHELLSTKITLNSKNFLPLVTRFNLNYPAKKYELYICESVIYQVKSTEESILLKLSLFLLISQKAKQKVANKGTELRSNKNKKEDGVCVHKDVEEL